MTFNTAQIRGDRVKIVASKTIDKVFWRTKIIFDSRWHFAFNWKLDKKIRINILNNWLNQYILQIDLRNFFAFYYLIKV